MTATNQDMQVSVSFGKFENDDSLSWEKFSSFSPNKYLDEVEKCATPGSVAQKKAYFESHYKKIAKRNAELILEQEKQLEMNVSLWSGVQNRGDRDNENDGTMMIETSAYNGSNGKSTLEEDNLVISTATEVNETCIHEPLEETMKSEECQSSVVARDDLNTLKLEKLEEIVCVEEKSELMVQAEDKEKPKEVFLLEKVVKEEMKDDISPKDTREMQETPMKEMKKEKDQNIIKKIDKNVRINLTRDSPKPNQMNKKPVASNTETSRKTQPSKERNMIKATNKAASPVSNPRVIKPASTISSMSISRSSVKKEKVLTLPGKKQTAPKSLDQSGSDPTALATTRKSLIMERMGDKDIVRRVFKTFQKNFDHIESSGDGKDKGPKQVSVKATTVSKLATTSSKENGRLVKTDGRERKGSNSYRSSSFVPKSNGTSKKHELSSPGTRAVERIHLPAKPKAEATNARTRRQSNPKEKSMQGPLPKSSSHKVL